MIHKLIVTKSGAHYWRKVKKSTKVGVYTIENIKSVTMINNGQLIDNYGDLIDIIESLTQQRIRDRKIEEILK